MTTLELLENLIEVANQNPAFQMMVSNVGDEKYSSKKWNEYIRDARKYMHLRRLEILEQKIAEQDKKPLKI